jgi:hypothetical protein
MRTSPVDAVVVFRFREAEPFIGLRCGVDHTLVLGASTTQIMR